MTPLLFNKYSILSIDRAEYDVLMIYIFLKTSFYCPKKIRSFYRKRPCQSKYLPSSERKFSKRKVNYLNPCPFDFEKNHNKFFAFITLNPLFISY